MLFPFLYLISKYNLFYHFYDLIYRKLAKFKIISENFSLVNCSFYIHYPAIWVNIFVSSFIYFWSEGQLRLTYHYWEWCFMDLLLVFFFLIKLAKFAWWPSGKIILLPVQEMQENQLNLWVRKLPWRRKWQPTPVFLPGKPCHRSLVGYSPWGQKVLDVTELEHGQHIFGRPYQVVLVNAEFRLNHW